MKRIVHFWKDYNIPVFLITIVISLSGLAFYNYYVQKNILLEQMKNDAEDLVRSITSATNRFHDVKSTMSIQKLISDVSLGLEIFEFRYIEPDGTIRNSMFSEEIGQKSASLHFKETMDGKREFGKYFYEVRDYVPVMAIYYPIIINEKLVGIIDLAVDISEYRITNADLPQDASLLRRQTDVNNLLKAISGSIKNSAYIYSKTDMNEFLKQYVNSAKNIVQISLVDQQGAIHVSSEPDLVGTKVNSEEGMRSSFVQNGDRTIYRMVIPDIQISGETRDKLLLLIDATSYVKNEKRLLTTALSTAGIAILFALFIAREIYYSALERSREEKERLEHLVKERTYEIELLSKTDALTGLWNRGHLEEIMEIEYKRARRYEHPLSFIVVDLDHFKKINDTYGHLGGDEVLRVMGSRLSSSLRETDFVGRYGGEEMVVVLPDTDVAAAREIADKILHIVSYGPVVFGETQIPVTASLGVSILRSGHTCYEEIFSEADEALYHSKNNGRNRVTVYTPLS